MVLLSDSLKIGHGALLLGLVFALLWPTGDCAAEESRHRPPQQDSSASAIPEDYFDHRGLAPFAAEQVEAPARALTLDTSSEGARERLLRAAQLSPGLPLVHFSLAGELGRVGEFQGAWDAFVRGAVSLPDHVEGRLWWMGSVGVLLALMMIVSALSFVFLVGVMFLRNAAHDLGDVFSTQMPSFARVALLSACLLVPLALGEGLIGLSCGFFVIGVLYGRSGHRTTLALAIALWVTGLFVVTDWAGQASDALEADRVAASALASVRGRATQAELQILEQAANSSRDPLAIRSLAIRAGRLGDENTLRQRLHDLLEVEKHDPMALVLLGNLAFRSGESAEATGLYKRATLRGDSFEIFFNLAQSFAKTFQIEQFEYVMAQAQAIDSDRAARLAGLGDPDLVLDPAFPMEAVGQRMWLASDGVPWVRAVSSGVAPGWLGASALNGLGFFALLWLLAWLFRGRYEQAGHCQRCGKTICARCDASLWSHEVCDSCHFLFSRPKAADPVIRNSRIEVLWARERWMGRCSNLLSLTIPGLAGMRIRRPGLAFVSIFSFVGSVLFWTFRQGPFPEPLATGEAASWILTTFSGLLFVVYLLCVQAGFSIRRRL